MANVRRWYVYLVSAISLQSVAWAVIILVRHLVGGHPYASVMTTAWQISLVLVGLPIFAVHWLWAQRLANGDTAERASLVRKLYLYGMLAGFLAPCATDTYTLLTWLLGRAFGLGVVPQLAGEVIQPADSLVALAVLAALWFFTRQIILEDAGAELKHAGTQTVRRVYVLGFSAAGLFLLAYALSDLLLRLVLQVAGPARLARPAGLPHEIARLLVGLALWAVFWLWAERLFAGPDEAERESVLRKIYLYAAVFVPALIIVTSATVALSTIFQHLLGVAVTGGYALQRASATIVALAPIWAYHARTLQHDANLAAERPQQAGIRRIYLYLIAGLGLAAFLIGLAGDLSVLIRSLSGTVFARSLQIQLAWYSAALIVGLPVWFGPWRQAQNLAAAPGPGASVETRSIVRRIYLYFYLFVATMTVLSSAAFVASRLIGRLLGAAVPGNLVGQVGQAVAFSLIGAGVWLYHGSILRSDDARRQAEVSRRLAGLRVTILDPDDGTVGRALAEQLRLRLPTVQLATFVAPFRPAAGETAGILETLAGSDIIAGPWTAAAGGSAAGFARPEVAEAVAASRACKVLIPVGGDSWLWPGLAASTNASLVEHAVEAVVQLASEGQAGPRRRLGPGGIAALILVALILLPLLIGGIQAFIRPF